MLVLTFKPYVLTLAPSMLTFASFNVVFFVYQLVQIHHLHMWCLCTRDELALVVFSIHTQANTNEHNRCKACLFIASCTGNSDSVFFQQGSVVVDGFLEQQLTGVSSRISCCGILLFDGVLVLPRLLHYCRLPQCSFPAGLLIDWAPRGLHERNPGEACTEIIFPLCTIDWCTVGGWSFHACIYILLFASRYYTIRRQHFLVGSVCPIYHGRWKCSQRPSRCSSDIGTVHL